MRWMWVWVNFGSWWWTGRPGVLQFMGSQRVGHNWATELNWTELLYNIVMVLPYINMNPPWVYMCSQSWTPSHLPPHTIPLGLPSAPAPSILYPASNLDWRFHFLYDIIHVSMPFSQIISPSPCPTESRSLFCTSVSLLLSHIQGYHYHLSKFHIYALVCCIGVFLSGLLHSV